MSIKDDWKQALLLQEQLIDCLEIVEKYICDENMPAAFVALGEALGIVKKAEPYLEKYTSDKTGLATLILEFGKRPIAEDILITSSIIGIFQAMHRVYAIYSNAVKEAVGNELDDEPLKH